VIRHAITEAALRAAIEREQPGWLDKAATRTARLVADGRYHEDTVEGAPRPSWSKIKGAYRTLQGDKCAYCEKLVGADYASVEHDVEHYRPKRETTGWGPRSRPKRPALGVTSRKGRAAGYFWLAYEPLNYCTSCKTCNSTLKSTRFPILGRAGAPSDTPAALQDSERPLLPYPLSDIDDDPEEIVRWSGLVARSTGDTETRRVRGKATIAFFALNGRRDLQHGRALQLVAVWRKLEVAFDTSRPPAERTAAADYVDAYVANDKQPHAACMRAFVRLARSDRGKAEALITAIDDFLVSIS
jgi:hypothetical protein